MFITLKTPNGPNDTVMEQVAVMNASSASSPPSRSFRKAACIACQAKKLRCTGRTRYCDRCKARSIACIFPESPAGLARRITVRGDPIEIDRYPPEHPENGNKPAKPTQTTTTTVTSILEASSGDSGFMGRDIFSFLDENTNDFVLERPSQGNASTNADDLMSIPRPVRGGRNDHDNSQHVFNTLQGQQALATPPTTDPGQENGDEVAPWNGSSPSPSCTCTQDAVRVVQQLDDDEFRITSLSLDQVLQLQKWITAQCCKPMDCPNCVYLPTVNTILLIICDRLAEMFECIHKRIKRTSAALLELGSLAQQQQTRAMPSSSSSSISSSSDDLGPSTASARAQLFCNDSGLAAMNATCNLQLFASEFRGQYSDEEQVHMMQVLLKLQVRNFRQLLARIDNANQIGGSQARRSKVSALVSRLAKANVDLGDSLQVILQALASS